MEQSALRSSQQSTAHPNPRIGASELGAHSTDNLEKSSKNANAMLLMVSQDTHVQCKRLTISGRANVKIVNCVHNLKETNRTVSVLTMSTNNTQATLLPS